MNEVLSKNVLDAPHDYPMLHSLGQYGQLKLEAIPESCKGMSVLDIGGYDGRFGYACLQRGATSAICLENEEWTKYYSGTWVSPGTFPGVEYVKGDFLIHDAWYDLVLCYNVLYHCEKWLDAIPALKRLTKGTLCISTYWANGTEGWKEYLESGTGFERATPTIPGLLKELADVGFKAYPFMAVKDETIVLRCL